MKPTGVPGKILSGWHPGSMRPSSLLTFRATDDVCTEWRWALAQEHILFPSWILSIHFLHVSSRNPGLREVIPLGCEWFTLTESRVSWYQKSTRVKTFTRKFNNFLRFYPSTIYKLKSFKVNDLEKKRQKTITRKGSEDTKLHLKTPCLIHVNVQEYIIFFSQKEYILCNRVISGATGL